MKFQLFFPRHFLGVLLFAVIVPCIYLPWVTLDCIFGVYIAGTLDQPDGML